MRPLHASVSRLSRCPCCQSRYSKKNSGGRKSGKTAARQEAKRQMRREMKD